MTQLRILPEVVADGVTNMSRDEGLLRCAASPCLRIYQWQPICISLGYFQKYDSIAEQLPPEIDVVRRITGGGAIWHADEVTYSLVGTLGRNGLPSTTKELYPLIHSSILHELRAAGSPLAAQAQTVGDRRYEQEPRCFASPAADDLIHTAGGKVLGSAARARGTSLLLHGSLKLATNDWDKEVTASCELDFRTAAQCLTRGIAQALDLTSIESEQTQAEIEAEVAVRQLRYANRDWVERRIGPKG